MVKTHNLALSHVIIEMVTKFLLKQASHYEGDGLHKWLFKKTEPRSEVITSVLLESFRKTKEFQKKQYFVKTLTTKLVQLVMDHSRWGKKLKRDSGIPDHLTAYWKSVQPQVRSNSSTLDSWI